MTKTVPSGNTGALRLTLKCAHISSGTECSRWVVNLGVYWAVRKEDSAIREAGTGPMGTVSGRVALAVAIKAPVEGLYISAVAVCDEFAFPLNPPATSTVPLKSKRLRALDVP